MATFDQCAAIDASWKSDSTHRFHRLFMILLLVCVVLVIFTRFNQQMLENRSSQSFMLNNITQSSSHRKKGAPYLAYIISAIEKRRNFTMNCLNERLPGFFNISHRSAVSHNDSRIVRNGDRQVSSLLLSHIDLWTEFGSKPEAEYADDDWLFIFEDDVDIVPLHIVESFYPNVYKQWTTKNASQALREILETGLKLAKDDGILYLGTCGPEYRDNATTMLTSSDKLIQYRRGFYFCTHAIAYQKWRARTFWGDLASYRFLHNEIGSDTIARKWQLHSDTYPISVGSNIQWPPGTGHYGFFYQARGRFASVIQG